MNQLGAGLAFDLRVRGRDDARAMDALRRANEPRGKALA